MKRHYNPKPLTISERFKFNKRNQSEGESVSDYVVELKRLSVHCDFGTFLNDALRDRFVCGLKSETTQKKLLAEDNVTFEDAVKIASAMEMAENDTVSFSHKAVNKVKAQFKGQRTAKQASQSQKTLRYAKKGATQSHRNACYRCGENHPAETCKHKNSKCFICSRIGHLARKCRSKASSSNYVETAKEGSSDSEEDILFVFSNSGGESKGYKVKMTINDSIVSMELDTGSGCTLMNEATYKQCCWNSKLTPTRVKLKGYSGESIDTLGETMVRVKTNENEEKQMRLVVVKGNKPNLLGRDWLKTVRLDWKKIFEVQHISEKQIKSVEQLKCEFQDLFHRDGRPIQGFKATIRMKNEATPIFRKARPVPFALKEQVTEELKRLEMEDVLERVETSKWATPLVVVPKPNKKLRLCGDYKVTVNQEIDEDQYPLPNTEDMFASLAGGQCFTKLDLSQAYTQLELEEDSKELLTLNTHLGLFRVKRLAYGVSSAPAIFQSVMDTVLAGLPRVVCRIDDILITEDSDEKHLQLLEEVLSRLKKHNIKLNKEKCEFMTKKVQYMGHMVDSEGIHTTEEKTKAIKEAAVPTNVSQLKSFLGLINYYGTFLKNLSSTLHPLHKLLRKEEPWEWTKECQAAFDASKDLLSSKTVLVHYDMRKELRLACDASAYGLGAVISHVMKDGTERPIAFASRTLTPAERNYAQIEKEALGIVFGVQKFHKYLYGRKFTLQTDHQALTTIFGPKKGIPTLAAARLQRWAIILSAYVFNIQYRKFADHGNCDSLSRLPIKGEDKVEIIKNISFVQDLPISSKQIAEATRKSPILSTILDYTQTGWPNHVEKEDMKPFFHRRMEMSSDNGVVLWGLRVVVPEKLQPQVLKELHSEHIGMNRMKTLARSYVWWPGLDGDIEETTRNCETCQSLKNLPPETPLHPWRWTSRPMERVHVDFADFKGQNFLLLIDSYSKWLEVVPMTSTTTERTIEKLKGIFSSTGIPEELVSDNGPQFRSSEFREFNNRNGIKHTLTPPYHPSSNGQVERAVQIVKKALKGRLTDNQISLCQRSVTELLADFLLKYRVTPHTTTGIAPCELFLKRQLRTRLSLLKPDKEGKVRSKQEKTKEYHDQGVKMRTFETGEKVLVKTNTTTNKWKWMPGTIHKVLGELTYIVRCDNKLRYCHADHLTPYYVDRPAESSFMAGATRVSIPSSVDATNSKPGPEKGITPVIEESAPKPPTSDKQTEGTTITVERRYPLRKRKAPERLDL